METYLLSELIFCLFIWTVPSGATLTVLPGMVDNSSSKTVKCLGFLFANFGSPIVFDDPLNIGKRLFRNVKLQKGYISM